MTILLYHHTETPTHIKTRTHSQCGDKTKKLQAPDDGCINDRNMLSIEEVKQNLINCDIKLVSYSSTIPCGIYIQHITAVMDRCDKGFKLVCMYVCVCGGGGVTVCVTLLQHNLKLSYALLKDLDVSKSTAV